MSVVKLGTNVPSLQAQRSLATASSNLSKIFERLSSGQRINSASDDAAGLSISSSLKADQRIYTQGIRNINDGVSALTIAQGALESLTTIVTRLKELATQAASGTFGVRQRKSLDQEAQELSNEYFRIARTAEFNGLNLLDGTVGEIRLQAGYGEEGGIASGLGGALGTGSFGERVSYQTGDFPRGVTLGDLNGDGFLDAVTAERNDMTFNVFLGNGDGTFYARTSYYQGAWTRSPTLGDLDGDGILDLVTVGEDKARVFLGKGDGTFDVGGSFATGGVPVDVKLGDLNGDGMLDMITVDNIGDSVSVFIGNGDGTFRNRMSISAGDAPKQLALGDLNGDGVLDMVLAGDLSTASVFLGKGDGTFHARTCFTTGFSPDSVALGDLNGDGILDMVTADFVADKVSVFIGKGDGSFNPRTSYDSGDGPRSVSLGDLNGDGVLDMVVSDYNHGRASVFIGA